MARPRKSRQDLNQEDPWRASPALAAPAPLVYDLRQSNGATAENSDRFYSDIAAFSDRVLAEIDRRASLVTRAYAGHVQLQLLEPPRSRGEYAIELLTLGLALNRYAGAAERTPAWAVRLAQQLLTVRHKSPFLKPGADLLRAFVTRGYLMSGIVHQVLPCSNSATCQRSCPCSYSKSMQRLCARFHIFPAGTGVPDSAPPNIGPNALASLPRLVAWMHASGEFEQEAERIANWRHFLSTLPEAEATRCLETASALFHWFRLEADRALGSYTRGVPIFLAGPYAQRGCREDQLFCGGDPVDYHLGMVAAEVMNRGLRPEFERTTRRVVLVPACMRGSHAAACRARASGPDNDLDITCTACDPACAVNRITRRMRGDGAEVYLVQHATGFSRWLDRWQAVPETGVTAVACMLNILPGGYQMRARGIPSQCVALDYPGCQKHWSSKAIPTGLNEDRLVQIVHASPHPTV